jgi:glycosyltransferase involved in cell wall biosynthesis
MYGSDYGRGSAGGYRETFEMIPDRDMNILFITNHLNVGGITSYVLSLSSGLKKKGHTVYIASSGGDLVGRFLEQGITYIRIPIRTKQEISPNILWSMCVLGGLIKKNKIDIIHVNSRTTQVLGALLHAFAGVTYISTCHGFFKKRFFRRAFPCLGKKVIAVSQQVRRHLVDDFGVAEEDIRVINNGIDADKFTESTLARKAVLKKELGLSEGPVVGTIGRLSDVKGHRYLVEAMHAVLKDVPEAQLLIVGDGKMLRELMLLTKRLGVEKKVFIIPSIMDTREALSLMDLFVMPSLEEGLGLSLMEAMAFRLAVIGSDVGGIKSLIRNEENGLLVAPRDPRALSSAISGLLRDPRKRKVFGERAREYIAAHFSLEGMVTLTEGVYKECLHAGF